MHVRGRGEDRKGCGGGLRPTETLVTSLDGEVHLRAEVVGNGVGRHDG